MDPSQGEGAVGQPTLNSIWNPGDRFQLPHSFPATPSTPKPNSSQRESISKRVSGVQEPTALLTPPSGTV